MSLKVGLFLTQNGVKEGGERMLGIDHQHAGWGEPEPGADPGVSRIQPGSPLGGSTAEDV